MEPTRFEQRLRQPEKVEIRRQRTRALRRILEFCGLSIDDVVNGRDAKLAVLRLYFVHDACEWESLRAALERRVDREWFERQNT